jgi:hypothetical protein
LPTGFLELKRLRLSATTTGRPYHVDQITSDELSKYWRSTASGNSANYPTLERPANMPRYVAIDDVFEFDVDPSEFTDDEPYAQILYYKRLTALSDDTQTNALLSKAPGAYFYGALVHSAPFLLDDERIATWEAAYQSIVDKLNATDRKRAGPLIPKLPGRTP